MIASRVVVYAHPGTSPYTGFVYIWKDRSNGKFYIGSHVGSIDDGYVGSGTHFKNAYKARKSSFRRRILELVCGDIETLLVREEYWLSMIDDSEMKGVKYYNRIKVCLGLHPKSSYSRELMRQKKLGRTISDEHKAAIGRASIGNQHNKGRVLTKEHRELIGIGGKGREVSQETRDKTAQTLTGVKHPPSRVEKMREIRAKAPKRNWYSSETETKLFVVGTQPEGWSPGRKTKNAQGK